MQTYITLNDGTKIPQFGLGVYQVPERTNGKRSPSVTGWMSWDSDLSQHIKAPERL